MKTFKFFCAILVPALLISVSFSAEQPIADKGPKPVPLMQVIPQPEQQVSIQRDGAEIARYHSGLNARRPFIFPVIGPSGRSLTRMGHPHDPEGHKHHYSVWIAHNDVNGVNFWDDRKSGRIVHQRVEKLEDTEDHATLTTLNHWINEASNTVLLVERRTATAQPLPNNEWLLVVDLQLESKDKAVTFCKTPFGLVGVRMAKTICINDGGGSIRNSEGADGEKDIFWKPAKWVDYSGPITAKAVEGITLFDHPSNPNHPSCFHVRSDGWMGASLSFKGPIIVEPGKPLMLRYGLYVHTGKQPIEEIQKRWDEFAKTPAPEPWKPAKKK
ncbi:MAG: PmoA family protein [Kiritimatiellae bacterium]|nr:PmoA family protein [Kiritimatiellia bacterium]MDD5519724.1 PmoA family protein [Kiritimatiellia bacterium]